MRISFWTYQQVVPHPDEQPALLPRVLQVQRLEVVPEASLPVPNDGDEAELGQPVSVVHWPLPPLEDDGHVELLDDQVDDLAGGGRRGHVQADGGARGQAGLVRSKYLEKNDSKCKSNLWK